MDVVDLTGRRFGKLTAVEYVGLLGGGQKKKYGVHKGYHTWKCSCECGNQVEVRSNKLRSGYTKSCGCLRKFNKPKWTLPEGEAAKNLLYHWYKQSANKRSLDFTLTKEEFVNIATQNCHYCGTKPNKSVAMKHKGLNKSKSLNGDLLYTGVDRLDNSLGYVIDNCLPCCWKCNQLKKADSKEEFLKHIARIAKNMELL